MLRDPASGERALDTLVPGLSPPLVAEQLRAELPAFLPPGGGGYGSLQLPLLRTWARWEARFGIVAHVPDVSQMFDTRFISGRSPSGSRPSSSRAPGTAPPVPSSSAERPSRSPPRSAAAAHVGLDVRVERQRRQPSLDRRRRDREAGGDVVGQIDDQAVRGGEISGGRRREQPALMSGAGNRAGDVGAEQQIRHERDDAGHRPALLGANPLELLTDRLGPAPHLHDLDAARADLADGQLALDSRVIEQRQRAVDRRRRRRMPETVRDQQPPMPVVTRVGLRIALHEQQRGIDVAPFIEDPQVELEVGPIVRKRLDDLIEGLGQRGCASTGG